MTGIEIEIEVCYNMSNNNNNNNNIVLVTGGTGYIAGHLIKTLLENGDCKIRATCRDKNKVEKYEHLLKISKECGIPLEFVSADLSSDDNWINILKNVSYVYHTASPVPLKEPKCEDDVIKPAVDGTLRILKLCAASKGQVKKVVLTSSIMAIISWRTKDENYKFNEKDWCDLQYADAYQKSKTMAELEAWNYMKTLKSEEKFDLVSINPSFVIGPMLKPTVNTSIYPIKRVLSRDDPGSLRLWFDFVDIRDVVDAHINAMKTNKANNKRYIIATGQGLYLKDVSNIFNDYFGKKGYPIIVSPIIPTFVLYIKSFFDDAVARILPWYGLKYHLSIEAAKKDLNYNPMPLHQTLIDCGESLIEHGLIKKGLTTMNIINIMLYFQFSILLIAFIFLFRYFA